MNADKVRVCVDTELCIGAGQCEFVEPTVFYLSDEDGIARVREGAELTLEAAQSVVGQCPSGALRIDE